MTRRKLSLKIFLIVATILSTANFSSPLFVPKWYPSSDATKGFLKEEPNTVDVLALGTSRTVFSSVPWVFWDYFGISMYSLAVEQQPTIASFYLLKEALKTQSLKAVIIEVQALNRDRSYQDGEAYFRQNFDNFPFSLNKMATAIELVSGSENQSLISYAIPFIRYHDRWDELTKQDYTEIWLSRSLVKGGLPSFNTTGISLFSEEYPISTGEPYFLPDDNEYYLQEIIRLCQKEKIDLVLYATPTYTWSQEQSAYYEKLSEQQERVYFIEFNTYEDHKETGFDISIDFNDKGGHVNSFGAEKLMKRVGSFLSEELGLADHRGDLRYSSWDTTVEYVKLLENDWQLNQTDDFLNYLSLLNDPNYVIAISSADDATNGLSDEAYRMMDKIGLDGPTQFRSSYIALIDGGNVVYEAVDLEGIEFTTSINNDQWNIVSVGGPEAALSSITINRIKFAPSIRGLNIVVYNKLKKSVISVANFDTYMTTMARKYRSIKPIE